MTLELLSCRKCFQNELPKLDLDHCWLKGTKSLPVEGSTCKNCGIEKISVVAVIEDGKIYVRKEVPAQ